MFIALASGEKEAAVVKDAVAADVSTVAVAAEAKDDDANRAKRGDTYGSYNPPQYSPPRSVSRSNLASFIFKLKIFCVDCLLFRLQLLSSPGV